ncbi:hypothetical protein OTU49_001647, partial [Cherax quadricarinatus]
NGPSHSIINGPSLSTINGPSHSTINGPSHSTINGPSHSILDETSHCYGPELSGTSSHNFHYCLSMFLRGGLSSFLTPISNFSSCIHIKNIIDNILSIKD